jgi:hypothetical protein
MKASINLIQPKNDNHNGILTNEPQKSPVNNLPSDSNNSFIIFTLVLLDYYGVFPKEPFSKTKVHSLHKAPLGSRIEIEKETF